MSLWGISGIAGDGALVARHAANLFIGFILTESIDRPDGGGDPADQGDL